MQVRIIYATVGNQFFGNKSNYCSASQVSASYGNLQLRENYNPTRENYNPTTTRVVVSSVDTSSRYSPFSETEQRNVVIGRYTVNNLPIAICWNSFLSDEE